MPSPNHPTHGEPIISYEDYQKMRSIVEKFESAPVNRPQDIDLNNPPKLPYRHQDFPRLVYAGHYNGDIHSNPEATPQQKRDMTLVVKDQDELDAAIEGGYLLEPPSQAVAEEEVVSPRRSRKKSE